MRDEADFMHLVIAIGGPHGTGKTTYAKVIAREFGLRHVSAGQIFRSLANERRLSISEFTSLATTDPTIDRLIDERIELEAKKGNVIVDGQLSAWMAGKDADMKIMLTTSEEVRIRRIAERDSLSYEDARRQTIEREKAERERYIRYYAIDICDVSVYDLIMDTGSSDLERNIEILRRIVSDLKQRPEPQHLRSPVGT